MNDTDMSGTGAALKEDDEPAPLKESSRSSRLRHRLRNVGAVIPSIAAVGAAIGGLTGYWNAWKVVRAEIFREDQSLQQNAASQPNIVPRLSLIVLPFANLNNDAEQDYFADGTQDPVREANELFDNALRLDPDNVNALVGKSWCLVLSMFNQWSASVETDKRDSVELIDRALARQPSSALAHAVKGEIIRFGNPEAAIAEYDAALQIDPNYPPVGTDTGLCVSG